ncbi:GtrA family protein [Ectobacillus sp. JY-23]|uniref:GtrA family protein n=1 Tax=Ectobacillus sp. JY-23 TaxID=2933872 RepID=UPI001FF345A4|nr:GtrA family protein [Ectobacillus sp. JY-23]UOY92478.1 GtrA family protein [Ectobacillus sp. JY-23]
MNKDLHRFLKFCTVGGLNTALDFTVFALLTVYGTSSVLAQVISYSAGICNSYIWNRTWTFRQHETTWKDMNRFIVVNLITLAVASLLLAALQHIGFSLVISKFITTAAGTVLNYIGTRRFVFLVERREKG